MMNKQLKYLITGSVFAALATIGNLLHLSANPLLTIFAFPVVVVFCGSLLLAQIPSSRRLHLSEWIVFSAGLSLLQLLLVGLILNTVGLEIHHPTLTRGVITISFDVLLATLVTLTVLRKRYATLLPEMPRLGVLPKTMSIVPLIFPVLAIFGAERINNGASDGLAVAVYITMILFASAVVAVKKLRSEAVFVSSLWCISVAILLSVSMRSNHLIGYDINQEFQVFQATLTAGLWHPHLLSNTYNACLSITILPTMINSLIPMSAEYTFKLVMQAIFGLATIGVYVLSAYLLSYEQKKKIYAYISALFFAAQYQYLNEFPALVREQVATLFFALVLISASTSRFSRRMKALLIITFSFGMTVSHYSTTYVCLILLLLTLILRPVLARLSKAIATYSSNKDLEWHVTPLLVVAVFLLAFVWYGETLNSTGNVIQKIGSSFKNISSTLTDTSRSPFVDATFGIGSASSDQKLVIEASAKEAPKEGYANASSYTVSPASTPAVTATTSSQSLVLDVVNKYIPAIVKLVVVIGAGAFVLTSIQKKRRLEEGALTIAGGAVFVLLVILPVLSQDYNLERLYQQLLVYLSPAFVVGMAFVASKLGKAKKYTVALSSVLLGVYFLCTSGLISQLYFGSSNINFGNTNLNYVHFYSQDADIYSLQWLQLAYRTNPQLINIDSYSNLKTYSYTRLPNYNLIPSVLPNQTYTGSYVYASSVNTQQSLAFGSYKNQSFTYTFPMQFLETNKNTIYSDGTSLIYR